MTAPQARPDLDGPLSPHVRRHLAGVAGYRPALQPGPRAIKLNANEGAYPPGPGVAQALAGLEAAVLQRYPDPLATGFREAAARLHGVDPDQIMATNGGDELLRLTFATFVDPGRTVGLIEPSYGVYATLAGLHGARTCPIALRNDWSLPEDTADRWNDVGAQLAILTNPHAPSGLLTSAATIERMARRFRGVLLVDEAYVDFVDPALKHDLVPLTAQLPNLLLLRSLSKGYSLAGLRAGYAIGPKSLIAPMSGKTRDSYNLDVIAQILGKAALEDQQYAQRLARHVRTERRHLAERLERIGFDVPASQANFVHALRQDGLSALPLLRGLQDQGIHVRWFDHPRCQSGLRISIGTSEETEILLATLRDLMA